MATPEQITRWCQDVLALIDKGITDVDALIAARGTRMAVLIAINTLIASRTIQRAGNTVWRIDKPREFFAKHRSNEQLTF